MNIKNTLKLTLSFALAMTGSAFASPPVITGTLSDRGGNPVGDFELHVTEGSGSGEFSGEDWLLKIAQDEKGPGGGQCHVCPAGPALTPNAIQGRC